jgi:anti-sigma factor RsiW
MMGDTSVHRLAWDQIPWIVNGSLPEAERLIVESHLQSCADCREEFEFQRRLATSMEPLGTEDVDSQQSWKRLRARIDASGRSERAGPQGQRRIRNISGEWIPWLVAAMVVQAIGLGVLGTVIWSKPAATVASAAGAYRTLSAPEVPTGAATIRAVFSPDMTLGRMQGLLAAAGLQVQSGPSSAGVWSLEPARDSNRAATQVALRELRDSPDVRFAEAIGGSP